MNIFKVISFGEVKSIVNFSLLHPVRAGKYIERLGSSLFILNKRVLEEIKKADIVVFESTAALLFFERIKAINPKAKLIYRASDDLEMIQGARVIVNYERKILKMFDLVSVPTQVMFNKYYRLSPHNVILQFHGIKKESFDNCTISPYKSNCVNFVFVGICCLDYVFLDISSKLYPNYYFHIIGPFKKSIVRNNVIFHGVRKFEETIPTPEEGEDLEEEDGEDE